MEHNSTFPIKNTELGMLRDEASSYLKSIQWQQGQRAKNRDKDTKDESILLYLSRANNGSSATVTSVSKTILALKKRYYLTQLPSLVFESNIICRSGRNYFGNLD